MRPNAILSFTPTLGSKLFVFLVLVGLMGSTSHAIIIRHDTGFLRYQVRESAYPQVFYLEKQGLNKTCVATLIDQQWAITAAHCLEQTSLAAQLANGKVFPVQVAGTEYRIDEAVVHPNYDQDAATDVYLALLHFDEFLTAPNALAIYDCADELGKTAEFLGWGYTGLGIRGRTTNDGKFRRAENKVDVAEGRLRFVFNDPRTGGDSLPLEGMPGLGDSGGPALLNSQGRRLVAGVAVGEVMGKDFHEETQGKYGSVAVYERLSLHIDWINMTLCAHLVC